jgi:hypothetical protein
MRPCMLSTVTALMNQPIPGLKWIGKSVISVDYVLRCAPWMCFDLEKKAFPLCDTGMTAGIVISASLSVPGKPWP